jgi:hypothetical protein
VPRKIPLSEAMAGQGARRAACELATLKQAQAAYPAHTLANQASLKRNFESGPARICLPIPPVSCQFRDQQMGS